jgi:hypothetical protein
MMCGSTRSQQMVRVRQAVLTAKCSVQYRPDANGYEYISALKKYENVR